MGIIHFQSSDLPAQGVGKKSLLKLFGLNAKGMPKVDLRHPQLPVFYCASSDKGKGVGEVSTIEQNCGLALEALDNRGTRNSVICFDDTVFWPTFSIMYFPEPVIVGGVDSKAWIELPDDEDLTQTIDALERDSLAQTCISFLLSRADSNHHAYDVCMRPRRLRQVTALAIMEEVGRVWLDATAANLGVPPLGQSCDNHASQVPMNALFAGLFAEKMKSLPFLVVSKYVLLFFVHSCSQ